MADFPVKWFSSDMGGSPENGDQYGALIELLKACLVTGFNTKPIAALTYDSTTQQATASVGSGHGYLKWQVIAISGADQAGYNGEHRVTAIGSDWVRFALDAAPAATEATGELIEIKAAPVGGWEIAAEDADNHRAVFTRTSERATEVMLMVENGAWGGHSSNAGRQARVSLIEEMTDIDTYTVAASRQWPYSAKETTRDWALLGDGLTMFYLNRYGGQGKHGVFVWGDIKTVRPGDAYHCVVAGLQDGTWSSTSDTYETYSALPYFGSSVEMSIARAWHQLPGAVGWALEGVGDRIGSLISYPNPQDNGFYVAQGEMLVIESGGVRGSMPGMLQPLHTGAGYDKAVIDNLPQMDGVPVMFRLAASRGNAGKETLMAWRLDRWQEV